MGVRCQIEGKIHLGAANLGRRPTVENGGRERLFEIHLLDFEGDIYGEEMEVEFLCYVRPEKKFESLDELKVQIFRDVQEVRSVKL